MIYVSLLIFLVAFSIWVYKGMIDIRPKVNRPTLNTDARQARNVDTGGRRYRNDEEPYV